MKWERIRKSRSSLGMVLTLIGLFVIVAGAGLLIDSLIRVADTITRNEDASYYDMTGSNIMDASASRSEEDDQTSSGGDMQKVLFISSYDPTAAYYQDQITGILSVSDQDEIEFDVLNMDTYKHDSTEDMNILVERARQMVSEESYAGVIAADDAALLFVEAYQDELFHEMPIVFFGINDHEEGRKAAMNPYMTGYLESDNISEVIGMARGLLPDTERIVFVYDDSITGRAQKNAIEQLSNEEEYRDLIFDMVDFSSYTEAQLQQIISYYQQGTVIINVGAYKDASGNYHTSAEASRIICEAASVPVFRNSKGGYGSGVCGGRVTDMKDNAADAAALMHDVLTGKVDTADQDVISYEQGEYVASYDVMQEYGLSIDDLPEGTSIIGEPETFSSRYGSIFYPMVMIVSGLLCIILGTYLELKSRMKTQKQLEFAMSHDPLTGCLSRQAAILQLHENPDLTDHPYSIILLDLDDFQEINETYGHDNGDLLLRTAAYELQALAAERKAMLCRYGGDEFMFVFDRPIQPEDDPVIDRILNVFRRGRKVGFDTIHLYGSAGIANAACRTSPSDLILHSELALQRSKHNGKNIVTLYTDDLLKAEQQREQTRSSVLDAIEHDGLYMLYQPQVDAQDGTLVGFEALVRLKNREIGPGVFIPMAEENGWIREIGRRTTEMTIRQIAQWRKAGLAVPPVSINYSAGQLNDTAYVGYLLSLLKEYDVPGCLIRLEITERLAMRDDEDVRALFREMQAAGIQFHMDDFGTGYSSFSYLSYVPVDTVKIDKSLVDAYLNPENETIFHDIVSMVHDMHKKTIVEGVETQQQYLKLKSFGCDMIQGYYFGRPLKAEQAAEDIRKKNLMPER